MWRLAQRWLLQALEGQLGLDAIDVGCGAGLTLQRLMGLRPIGSVVGIEPDPHARELARARGGFEIIAGSALELPLADHSVDVLTCLDVLQHLPRGGDAIALSEFARALRPGGILLARTCGVGFARGRDRGGSAYRRAELGRLVEREGFLIERISYVNMLPSLAQELRGRVDFRPGSRRWRPNPAGGGLRIDVPLPRANRRMATVAALDRLALRCLGGRLPFGHSLLVLARKRPV